MNRWFVKPARRGIWKMRKGALLTEKRRKGAGSDRPGNRVRKGKLARERAAIVSFSGPMQKQGGLRDEITVTEEFTGLRTLPDAGRAVEIYMEERALKKELADDDC